jgi:hypothetical protein
MRKEITIGEKYGPVVKIKTQKAADAYFEKCVKHNMSFGNSREKAVSIEKGNIGYYAGYYDRETQQRINTLFNCTHPILGDLSKMTPEEAFFEGVKFAGKINGGNQ